MGGPRPPLTSGDGLFPPVVSVTVGTVIGGLEFRPGLGSEAVDAEAVDRNPAAVSGSFLYARLVRFVYCFVLVFLSHGASCLEIFSEVLPEIYFYKFSGIQRDAMHVE